MPRAKLDWCIVRLGEDLNWWVEETSDDIHWDVDSLGIIDPRQLGHLMDLLEPLREYGYEPENIESAFYTFRIEKELKGQKVRLARLGESLFETEEQSFALPDMTDEEKGAYADFLDQISKARVKMLNDLIEFDQSLTVDELEEAIRERQNADYFEGRAVHPFNEITSILEYVPEGYELDIDEDESGTSDDEEGLEDIPDFEEDDESIEEDETMRWEDEDEEEEDDYDEDEEDSDEDEDSDDEDEEDEDEDISPRGRRR
ncbi:MAG: hypothetical protein JW942_05895 [Opitutales bacterium]|nr:hypothetical protein [Opitutales bacterium]